MPFSLFLIRVFRYFFFSLLLIAVSIGIGVLGYHLFADLGWVDAFYNACMILTGMGPVSPMPSDGAKIFSSLYALFSGVAFLSTIAIFFAPIAHRFLHILHLEEEPED